MTQHSGLTPEQRKRIKDTFTAVTSIANWAQNADVQYFADVPYVFTGNLFYYFGVYPDGYKLVMTSTHDIGEMK